MMFKVGNFSFKQINSKTERTVEIPLLEYFINAYDNVCEVGAVSPYYFKHINHIIIDLYDKYDECIRKDASKFDVGGKDIVSISTVEHMGLPDYGNKDLDRNKGIIFIEKVYHCARNYLITFPIGFNKFFDNLFFGKYTNYNNLYKKGDKWVETNLHNFKYNFKLYQSNAVCVFTNIRQLLRRLY